MADEIPRNWRDPALLVKALPTVILQTDMFPGALGDDVPAHLSAHRNFQLQWTWDLWTWTDIFSKPHYWTILIHTLFMAAGLRRHLPA